MKWHEVVARPRLLLLTFLLVTLVSANIDAETPEETLGAERHLAYLGRILQQDVKRMESRNAKAAYSSVASEHLPEAFRLPPQLRLAAFLNSTTTTKRRDGVGAGKCPDGWTGQFCDKAVCSKKVGLIPHTVTEPGDLLDIITQENCQDVSVPVYLDNYLRQISILVRGQRRSGPTLHLTGPSGELFD